MLKIPISNGFEQYSTPIHSILKAVLDIVDPYECIKRVLRKKNGILFIANKFEQELISLNSVYLIGAGKAVLPMALAACEVIGVDLEKGILIAKHENNAIQSKLPEYVTTLTGDHPIPSEKSVDSTRKMVEVLSNLKADDLVIFLLSGGGSALMTLPFDTISIEDLKQVTEELLRSGATIEEMNIVRKHLDTIKGGGLARKVYPAKLITLVLSDVVGDALEAIASGPTVADASTFANALEVLNKYYLTEKTSPKIIEHLELGKIGSLPETVKQDEKFLKYSQIHIIGSVQTAVQAAYKKATEEGFHAKILTTQLKGEAKQIGMELGGELKQVVLGKSDLKKPTCIIAGGETTVTVRGDGKGGRNQELALSAAREIKNLSNCLLISIATDGEDGPTDAAGAIVDGNTIPKGKSQGLNVEKYLQRNDAYHYLEKTGSLIRIGPTGTNVNDLVLMFAF